MSDRKAWAILALGWLSACSSSPNERNQTSGDAGAFGDGSAKDAMELSEASITDAAKSCNPYSTDACSEGQTCCISSSAFGTCLDLGACTTTTQFECSRTQGCGPDEVCCGTFVESASGEPTATTFCEPSCTAPAHETCTTSTDCIHGGICTPLPEGGKSSILAVAAEAFLVCLPPDGGV